MSDSPVARSVERMEEERASIYGRGRMTVEIEAEIARLKAQGEAGE